MICTKLVYLFFKYTADDNRKLLVRSGFLIFCDPVESNHKNAYILYCLYSKLSVQFSCSNPGTIEHKNVKIYTPGSV